MNGEGTRLLPFAAGTLEGKSCRDPEGPVLEGLPQG